MVYFTVAGHGSIPGGIKRAYLPSVDDGTNNIGAAVNLDIKYITSPDGIAVDWVGRCVSEISEVTWLDSWIFINCESQKLPACVKTYFVNSSSSARRNLYWADSNLKRLEVALLDGRYRKHLVNTELGHPSAVAVNPQLGWGRFEDRKKIYIGYQLMLLSMHILYPIRKKKVTH